MSTASTTLRFSKKAIKQIERYLSLHRHKCRKILSFSEIKLGNLVVKLIRVEKCRPSNLLRKFLQLVARATAQNISLSTSPHCTVV